MVDQLGGDPAWDPAVVFSLLVALLTAIVVREHRLRRTLELLLTKLAGIWKARYTEKRLPPSDASVSVDRVGRL